MRSLASMVVLVGLTWGSLWFSPDQQGQRLFDSGEFNAAAQTYRDPMHIGTAWYRDGDWEKAEKAFASIGNANAEYNRGNCLMMQGKYEQAIGRYDRALQLQPDLKPALVNREIAMIRAERNKREGGDMGDQKLGADEIVFDKKENSDQGQDTQVENTEVTDETMQAMWLRRVQTKPADFLRNKFAYQVAMQDAAGTSDSSLSNPSPSSANPSSANPSKANPSKANTGGQR